MRSKFCIRHYAGDVVYTVTTAADLHAGLSWIMRNNDSIPEGLLHLYESSSLPEFKILSVLSKTGGAGGRTGKEVMRGAIRASIVNFNMEGEDGASMMPEDAPGGARPRRKSVMMRPTIAALFAQSMQDLNQTLLATECHFVRCIKPNAHMQAGEFDNLYVLQQMRSLGIMQACEVLKVSLPSRVTYAQLKASLCLSLPPPLIQPLHGLSDISLIACILRALEVSEGCHLGTSKIFFRPVTLSP
ncbi:P-loop containing nucleoside triphosphate hydrolase protein [Ochromonadaceae sp. CCMP2298]|nr:P-loop containing nucleoside triphosphate hydrolase protein [Ochromonadaceae sp. CCMP2298]